MPDLARLTDRLHRLEDGCNVYVVTSSRAALAIDAGLGAVGDAIAAADLGQLEWVLHTHCHRDQCDGTNRLRELGAQVAVPEHERTLFERAERGWQARRVFDNYDDRNTFLASGVDIPIDATLRDYESFAWRDLAFEVLPAKGHTAGSSLLIVELDGLRVAFVGDLLHAGGVLYQLHAMEYEYGAMEGILFTIESVQELRAQEVDLVLPSHGPPVHDVARELDDLLQRLIACLELGDELGIAGWKSDTRPTAFLPHQRFIQLSEHLLWSGEWTCAGFYVLLGSQGRALLVDYGHSSWAHLHTGADHHGLASMRFVRHHLDVLRRDHGVETIDVVIPTHVHDDHTCGIPYLQRYEGTACWALAEVGQVLADPAGWASTPCVYPEPIRVDRTLADGERFTWDAYELEVHFAPGQTEFACVLATTVDGRKVAFTGDNVMLDREGSPFQTTVLRNSYQPWMHRKCVDVMARVEPDLVCPGHGPVIEWSPAKLGAYTHYVERKEAAFAALVPEPAGDAIDLFWARLVPYVVNAAPRDRVDLRLMLRSNHETTVTYRARLRPAAGWTSESDWTELELAPRASGEIAFDCVAPDFPHDRRLQVVEVEMNGRALGPLVEGVVTVTGPIARG